MRRSRQESMKHKKTPQRSLLGWFDKYGTILAFGLTVLFFSIVSPYFRSGENFVNLGMQTSFLLVSGLGLTLVALTGEIDLSLGGLIGLGNALFAGLLKAGYPVHICISASVGACLLFGITTGLLVAYRRLSSFVVTVAMMFLAMGFERYYSGGFSIWIRDPKVLAFASGSIGPVPNVVLVAAIVAIVMYIIINQTRTGMHVQAVGQNAETARSVGISVKRIKLCSFIAASLFYAIAGILVSLRSSGTIVYAGQALLLPTMAVTFVSQTVLGARRPNVFGVLVGALILGAIHSAFTLLNIKFYYVPIAQGLLLVIAAALSAANRREIPQDILA